MKFTYLLILSFLFFLFSCTPSSPDKVVTFKVWGNCDICKKTIETACFVNGVKEKDWNVDSKLITIKFDTTLTNLDMLQQLIAKSGYDNEGYFGDDYTYARLKACCQYERRPFETE